MIIIYTGRGLVVPIATFVVSLCGELLTRYLTKDNNYYQDHGLPLATALCIAAILTYAAFITAYKDTRDEDGRVVKKAVIKWMDHTMFFVNIRIWAIILIVCGIITLAIRGI